MRKNVLFKAVIQISCMKWVNSCRFSKENLSKVKVLCKHIHFRWHSDLKPFISAKKKIAAEIQASCQTRSFPFVLRFLRVLVLLSNSFLHDQEDIVYPREGGRGRPHVTAAPWPLICIKWHNTIHYVIENSATAY